jgi:hypothetical protein
LLSGDRHPGVSENGGTLEKPHKRANHAGIASHFLLLRLDSVRFFADVPDINPRKVHAQP